MQEITARHKKPSKHCHAPYPSRSKVDPYFSPTPTLIVLGVVLVVRSIAQLPVWGVAPYPSRLKCDPYFTATPTLTVLGVVLVVRSIAQLPVLGVAPYPSRSKCDPYFTATPHLQSLVLYWWSDPSPSCPYWGLPAARILPLAIQSVKSRPHATAVALETEQATGASCRSAGSGAGCRRRGPLMAHARSLTLNAFGQQVGHAPP